MDKLRQEKDAHIDLIVDLHTALSGGQLRIEKFEGRIVDMYRTLTRWRTHDDERIRMAGLKMTEILEEVGGLLRCRPGDRRWTRTMAKIGRLSDVVDRRLKEVGMDDGPHGANALDR
ncbi:hypothetical protein [Brevibacillus reuszeri]|uniref:hypothetical protein n=1 Tax=Brevibacillus reuszeri TaxID=54915 RepID=UPI0013DF0DBD|nr:hypothetical protein [Brevibacillus reuszeri]